MVVMACTSRHSWAEGLLRVGLGLGEGLLEPEPVGLGEGEAEAEVEGLLLGLAELLLVALGVAEALLVAFVLAVALALAVAVALGVAEALVLPDGDGELLDLAALDLGALDDESEAASRTTTDRPAGTVRAAEVVAGGWPQTLGAAALAVLTSAAVFTVLASAAVLTPRRPMPEETMAAPATMPNAEDPDRADLMAAPSSPWSSSLRPRVSSYQSDRPCAETIPCCRSSTHAPRRTVREHRGLPASSPEY